VEVVCPEAPAARARIASLRAPERERAGVGAPRAQKKDDMAWGLRLEAGDRI